MVGTITHNAKRATSSDQGRDGDGYGVTVSMGAAEKVRYGRVKSEKARTQPVQMLSYTASVSHKLPLENQE